MYNQIGQHKIALYSENGSIKVIYHNTAVYIRNENNKTIELRNGGWLAQTTKKRINQAFNVFGDKYILYQKDYTWYIEDRITGIIVEFYDRIVLDI